MKAIHLPLNPVSIRSILMDITALGLVYFTPALSHLLSLPLYLIEPMRLMVILAMVHTHKANAYILALSLPLFSFMVSGHPVALKTGLISMELLLNVFLFLNIKRFFSTAFLPMFLSVLISKGVYYALKASLISFALIQGGLVATPLLIQLIVSFLLATYAWFWLRKQSV